MQIDEQLFSKMEAFAQAYGVPILQPESVRLLTQIVQERKPRLVLEIGTAIGYSALQMTRCLPDGSRIISLELDADRVAQANAFIADAHADQVIEVVHGDAGQLITALKGQFDLVFIDAAKGQYLDYFCKLQGKLTAGAIIVADNVLFRGLVQSECQPPRRFRTMVRRLRQYLAYVSTHADFTTVLHDIGDGMAISYYRGTNCGE